MPVTPGSSPAQRYRAAALEALSGDELPDAAVIVVTDRDGELPGGDNPYLHSKAVLLMAGLASQHARLSTITSNPNALQYVLQNISIALYAKMKGVPWTVDHDLSIADELVIGIGTAELSDSRIQRAAALRRHHHRVPRRRELPSRPADARDVVCGLPPGAA